MPPICVQESQEWLHKSIGNPCLHGKPNPAPEPTRLHLEDDIYLLCNCLIWVFLEASEQWTSLCDWTSPSSKDFLEAVTHQLCSPLGSAPRWVEKKIPPGTPPHPTAPRKVKVLFDHKLAALPMPVGVCGQYQMFSKTCGGHVPPHSQGHKDCAICWEMFKDTWAYTRTLLSACTAQRGMHGPNPMGAAGGAQIESGKFRGAPSSTDVSCLSPFFPCQMELPETCKYQEPLWKMLPRQERGWCLLTLTVPETRGTAWGQREWGNPLYSIIWF